MSTLPAYAVVDILGWHCPSFLLRTGFDQLFQYLIHKKKKKRQEKKRRQEKKTTRKKRHECCQDDSVNGPCFRKDNLKLKACSIHVRARVRMSIVQLSCICLWTS